MQNATVCCQNVSDHLLCNNQTFVLDAHQMDAVGSAAFDIDLSVCFGLIVVIGMCHGLNTAILSLDESMCDILIRSGAEPDASLAKNVLPLVKRRVWFLLSFLLLRVVCAESLPIFVNHMLQPLESIIVSSVVVVFCGDLLPALLFGKNRLALASFFRYLCFAVMGLTGVVSWPLSKLIGAVAGDGGAAFNWTRANLKVLVNQQAGDEAGDEGDLLTADEAACVAGALDLSVKTVFDVMVPIGDVFMLEEGELVTAQLVELLLQRGFSRVPIFRREKSHVIGFVLVRDLLTLFGKSGDSPIAIGQLRVRRLIHVGSQISAAVLLREFKSGQAHIALVVARDLVTPIGIVCFSDVLELLVGSIADELDHDEASGVAAPRLLAHGGQSRRHGAPTHGTAGDPPRLSKLVSQRLASRRLPPPSQQPRAAAPHPAALSRAPPGQPPRPAASSAISISNTSVNDSGESVPLLSRSQPKNP